MTDLPEDLRAALGRRIRQSDVATAVPVRALAVTLERDEPEPVAGSAVPPGWHGLYFLALSPRADLGEDGLPTASPLLPEMPFPRRMYAGENLRFHRPIRVGDELTMETELADITLKTGSTGRLAFVTTLSRISGPDGLCLEEEKQTVFREETPAGAGNRAPRHEAPPEDIAFAKTVSIDIATLFRFSALTFNPHRIHYDRPYATGVEGYPGLVVHGPLVSTLLIDFARDHNPGRRMRDYRMRARAPLFDTAPFRLAGRPAADGSGIEVWALTPEGTVAMQAVASFED